VNHVLHPELFHDLPCIGHRAAEALDQRIEGMAGDDLSLDPQLTVAVRTFNEAPKLERLLGDVARQAVGSQVEIVVVDNESTDNTRAVAREYGATVVTLPRGQFTYPRSMNLAMEAASNNTVFLTVAHALLSSTHTLHAGARHVRPGNGVAGVFAMELSAPEASFIDNIFRAGNALELFRAPQRVRQAGTSVMGATGAIFSKEAWWELGRFDERYETGGEDTAMARAMLAAGYGVIKEPAMAVHHAHGLGLKGTAKEMMHYRRTVRGPQPMQGDVKARRQSRFDNQ
jgi:GT2 family glycosyltransferase